MKKIVLIMMIFSVVSVVYAKTFTSKGLNNNFKNGLLLVQNDIDVDPQSQLEEPYPVEPQEDLEQQIEDQPVQSENSVENDV